MTADTIERELEWARRHSEAWAGHAPEERTMSARVCDAFVATHDDLSAARRRIAELEGMVNTPELHDFARGVVLEAVHQRERWGTSHDGGKTDADWFWLIGYLAGKALHNPPTNDGRTRSDVRLHRIITVAAAAANWHSAILGKTDMRPGIEPPKEPTDAER